jgi:hypothetical protein
MWTLPWQPRAVRRTTNTTIIIIQVFFGFEKKTNATQFFEKRSDLLATVRAACVCVFSSGAKKQCRPQRQRLR